MQKDLLEACEQKIEIEGQRRYEVDDVDGSAKERESVRCDDEADDQFEGEPSVADALDVEEGIVWERAPLIEQPRRRGAHRRVAAAVARTTDVDTDRQRDVLYRRNAHVGMCFEAERQDRDDDKEHGQSGEDLEHTQIAVACRLHNMKWH